VCHDLLVDKLKEFRSTGRVYIGRVYTGRSKSRERMHSRRHNHISGMFICCVQNIHVFSSDGLKNNMMSSQNVRRVRTYLDWIFRMGSKYSFISGFFFFTGMPAPILGRTGMEAQPTASY
jgi:hypothetical protein